MKSPSAINKNNFSSSVAVGAELITGTESKPGVFFYSAPTSPESPALCGKGAVFQQAGNPKLEPERISKVFDQSEDCVFEHTLLDDSDIYSSEDNEDVYVNEGGIHVRKKNTTFFHSHSKLLR